MAGYPEDGWSVLVLRVWFEESTPGFRARIVSSVGGEKPATAVFARPDDLLDALRQWIDELVTAAGRG